MPYRIAMQQFKRFYGAAYYYGGVRSGRLFHRSSIWPTRDGIIPWQRFKLDYQDMWHVLALERLNMSDAVMLGLARSRPTPADSQVALDTMLNSHIDEAYPKD